MPTADQKPTTKPSQKRGSLTGDKTKKVKKKKKSKKSAKLESKDSQNNLEIEGTNFQNDDESDDSSNTKEKTPVLSSNLSASDVSIKCDPTPRAISTDSHSTHSSLTKQTDTKSSTLPRFKTQSRSADSLSAKFTNLSLKGKSSKSKTKSCHSAKSDRSKTTVEAKTISSSSSAMPNIVETPQGSPIVNESIRWENKLGNPESERERIHLYKINRRKRYLAAAQLKGLGWVKQYGVNGFPLSEESVVDIRNSVCNELSPVPMLRNSHSILTEGKTISI